MVQEVAAHHAAPTHGTLWPTLHTCIDYSFVRSLSPARGKVPKQVVLRSIPLGKAVTHFVFVAERFDVSDGNFGE